MNELRDGFVKLDEFSSYGNSSSILLASCEPGLHSSSLHCSPRSFETSDNRRADAPGCASPPYPQHPIRQASRPCISLSIVYISTPNQSSARLSTTRFHVSCWHTFAAYFHHHTLLAPTLVSLPPVAQHTFPSYLPSLLTLPSDLIHWLRMDADFLVPRVSYAYYIPTSFIIGKFGMTRSMYLWRLLTWTA